MDLYLKIFLNELPEYLIKYLDTDTLKRIKNITQFCGADYTKLYSPAFLYTRFHHSLICALMVSHFTKDKKEAIKALHHDATTPCFAHVIDFVFGDYIKQTTAERKLSDIIKLDNKLVSYLKSDGIEVEELDDLSDSHILENHHPRLCVDRLDGVLHTCYIWLHTHPLSTIKRIYDNLVVLENEDGLPEIGFQDLSLAEEFVSLVNIYAKELRSNKDKYVMTYIAEIVKSSFERHLITLDDLYQKHEDELVDIFACEFKTWGIFADATYLSRSEIKPNQFCVFQDVKKRNTIPLVKCDNKVFRVNEVSDYAKRIYEELDNYQDSKYAYVKKIRNIE